MRKASFEKLKEIIKGGAITEEKIKFARMILDDIDCPISIEKDITCFADDVEIYRFESTRSHTIIEKEVFPILGNINYGIEQITSFDGFKETKKMPLSIDNTCAVYIEETKSVFENGRVEKSIIDSRIIILFNDNGLENSYTSKSYIIA